MLTLPLGRRWSKPNDDLTRTIARAISTDTPVRNKLLSGIWTSNSEGTAQNPIARYNALLNDYDKAEKLYKKVTKAYNKGKLPMEALHPEQRFEEALSAGIFTKEEADFMRQYESAVLDMLTVDDFPFEAFAHNKDTLIKHNA